MRGALHCPMEELFPADPRVTAAPVTTASSRAKTLLAVKRAHAREGTKNQLHLAGGVWNVDCFTAGVKVLESTTAFADPAVSEQACPEQRRLLGALRDAVHDSVQVHDDQFFAVLDGEPDLNRFRERFYGAARRRLLAKQAYLEHIQKHGCGSV